MNNLGQAFVEILPNLKKWGSQLRTDIVRASQPALAEGEKKFGGFVSRVKNSLFSLKGAMGLAFGGAAIATAGKWAFSTASALQQAQISFESMLGSAEEAKKFIGDLKTFAASTPFELPGLIASARQLVGAGTAAKDVIPTLRAYGDASGALGLNQEQFKRVMLAVTQSMNKGKVQAEELMQITEAGIPIYPLLSKALGMSVPKIQDLASKGKLLSKDVLPLLQAQMTKDYGGAMAKQATTLSGLWSTLMDTMRLGLSDAIQPLLPMLGTFLPAATERLGNALKVGGQALAGFVHALQMMFSAFRTGMTEDEGTWFESIALHARDAWQWLQQFAAALAGLGITFQNFMSTGRGVLQFYRDHTTLVQSMAAGITAMFVAFKGYQIAVVAINAVRIAMLAFRMSVITTTAAMLANPIGIVVLAIVGLIAALVVLYKRNEDFRNIVQQVWASIKTAVGATIAFLQPYITSFMNAMRAVGTAALWLWHNAIVPAFNAISVVVGIVIKAISVYIKAWIFYIKTVATVVTWLYSNVVSPIFTLIGIAVKVFYALFQVYVGLIKIAIKALAAGFQWLWKNAIAPYLTSIGKLIAWLYNSIVKPYFTLIGAVVQAVWKTAIKPAFDAIRDAVQNKIAPAFVTGVAAIKKAWEGVKEAAKAPVRFVVNTVINNGIIDTFNKIAGVFGVSKVGHVTLPKGFASGGKFSDPTAIVGEGKTRRPEYVIPTDPKHRNRALALYGELGAQLMAGGGIIGKIGDIGGKVGGFIGNIADSVTNPAGMLKKIMDKLIGGTPGGGFFRSLVMKLPAKIVSFLTDKITSAFSNFEMPGGSYEGSGGGTGGGLVAFGRWLQRMGYSVTEHPAFGGVHPVHTAGSRHYQGRAIDVNHGAGTSSTEQAWLRKIIGPAHAAGFRTIFMAPGHYNHAHIDYDNGGVLPPGLSLANNRTGHGELVAPNDKLEDAMYRAMSRALSDAGVGEVILRVDGEEFKKVIRVESRRQVAVAASALKVGRR